MYIVYIYIYNSIYIYAIAVIGKKAMDLKNREDGYIGGFGVMK